MVGKNKVTGSDEFFYKVNLMGGNFFIFSSSEPDTSFYSLTPETVVPQTVVPQTVVPNIESRVSVENKTRSKSSIAQILESKGGAERLIKKCLVEQLQELAEEDIKNESLIAGDLHGDQLDVIEIMMRLDAYLECEFPFDEGEFPNEEDVSTYTVQMLIDYVNTFAYGTTEPPQTQKPTTNTTAISQNVSVADELKKLAELRDLGILTEEEFLDSKRKLLSS